MCSRTSLNRRHGRRGLRLFSGEARLRIKAHDL